MSRLSVAIQYEKWGVVWLVVLSPLTVGFFCHPALLPDSIFRLDFFRLQAIR
ncbi:hypothetical protein HED96_004864 [Salmonella enterica]|nr:hypothetical protein [Salmonella enterica]